MCIKNSEQRGDLMVEKDSLEDQIFMCPYNTIEEVKAQIVMPENIMLYDVTLRDGEQTPGVVFRKDEKVEIATALSDLGVHRIEGSMPVVSPEDQEALKEIANLGLKAEIWGFCRALKSDIDANMACDVSSVVVEIPTSTLKQKAYGFSREKIFDRAIETLLYAKEHGLYTAYFSVDMTRTELEFLEKINKAAVQEGHADEIVVVDTLGVASPEAMYFLTKKVKEWVDVPLHIHCHNDFGLAVAGQLAGLKAGAETLHCTLNGLGEKSGNADLAELVLALYLLYGIDIGVSLEELKNISKLTERLSKFPMAPNKPVVGDNLFRRESGSVTAQLIKYPPAVEGFPPELIGSKREIVFGKKSGSHSIEWKLEQLSRTATEAQVKQILTLVKSKSEEKKDLVTDKEFVDIIDKVL